MKRIGISMGKRIIFYLLGILIACLGVTFIVKVNVGAGPWDIVNLGLSEKTGLTFGTWVAISQGFFLLLNGLILKKRPEFESLLTVLLWGTVTDFWMEIVFKTDDYSDMALLGKWGIFLLGILLIGMGVGIYLTSNLPKMPYDGTMVALSQKFNMSLTASRTILEGCAVVLGLIIGGSVRVGIGTVIIFLLIGQLIQFFNKLSNFVYNSKSRIFIFPPIKN
jgi:uncharacterized membrane protein YczE